MAAHSEHSSELANEKELAPRPDAAQLDMNGSAPRATPAAARNADHDADPDAARDSLRDATASVEKDLENGAPQKPLAHEAGAFPDGGLKAWTTVLGSFFCLFVSFGWINCIGVFQEYYQTHQLAAYSPSTIAWIPSLETFMMFLGGPVFGKILDSYGPRWLLLAGSFLHVFGLMMASISTRYYEFILSQGIVSPIGASIIFYSAISTTSTWFFKRRALALGIVASGSSLGGVIFPIMIEHVIAQRGFPWAMRAAAFLILGLLVISNLTVRSRLPPNKTPVVLKDFVRPFTERTYVLITIASILFFFGIFIPFTYLILQGRSIGMSPRLARYLIPILNASSLFGRILPGWIADRVGRFNVMIFTSFFSGIIVLALWCHAHTNASVIVFAALFGFSSGAFVSISPALVAQISDVRQIGVRNGSLFAVISVAALTGSPIAGAISTHQHGRFDGLQIFAGSFMLVGALFFTAARISLAGFKVGVKV